MRRRSLNVVLQSLLVVGAAAAAWYLHDPPWVGEVTSGLREWRTDSDGTRFRWTNGHGAFYVPATAREMTLPLRIPLLSADLAPVTVRVSVDDRWLADLEIRPGAPWTVAAFPLPDRSSRRFRRIDVRVSRVSGFEMLGAQLGEPALR